MSANSTKQPSLDFEALSVAATFLEHQHPTHRPYHSLRTFMVAVGLTAGVIRSLARRLGGLTIVPLVGGTHHITQQGQKTA
jgi:hypothetical protein